MKELYITDKQVAAILGVSPSTLSRILNGFKRGRRTFATRHINLMEAEPVTVGQYRRWLPRKLANVLGVEVDEIIKRI